MKRILVAGLAALGLLAVVGVHKWNSPKDVLSPDSPAAVAPAQSNSPVSPPQAGPLALVRVRPQPQREVHWSRGAAEPPFAAFAEWTRRYLELPAGPAKAALETEGAALARGRLTALANLIVTHPERALELAVPSAVRQAMPKSVQAFLEESVNTRADYEVVCVMPLPGQEPPPLLRSARVHGETYRVFTFGRALDYVTRKDVPVNGIAVPVHATTAALDDPIGLKPSWLMALAPSPARVLDQDEVAERAKDSPVALEFGGEVRGFATMALAEDWAATQTAAEDLEAPQLPATSESPYTEGRKRFLLMRVDFPDYMTDVFPTNNALSHMRDMSNFLAEISYYKHVIAPVGEGSDITPILRMNENAAAYDNAGLSKLYPEARDVARTNYGYDLGKYDFFFVCTGGRPSYGYAGLGYVGGVGYHLANGYFDVRTSAHEFGHNLGLGHANWWDTGGRSAIGPGSNQEYGDDFDTMGGSGGGRRHFSSHFKARLGWIPGADAPTVTTSGIYRLHAHDLAAAPVGLRCLRVTRPSGDPYALEFRQLWTDNKALMNGINLRWGGGSSELLDMNPGSDAGKNDHPLTIGRTFTDPAVNGHFTPLGKAHTYPESIDVAVNLGSFPGNQSPSAVASASPATASAGQMVSFTVTATDPNGDALACFWDFGDGDYSVDNSAHTTHSFTAAGEFCVQVTVSDMKGGTARDSVIVAVGNPATYRIAGRVLDGQSRPVPGMKVYVNSTRYAFTGSDGTYTITRLASGSYTVEAVDPVRDGYNFLRPFFNNPVVVGPNFTAADFIASTNSTAAYLPIVTKESTWKYLDDGSNQGTAWTAPSFDDRGWSNGTAILGYGQDNENTVIGYGTNANDKHITYYFRKSFSVPDPAAYTNLLLEVLRDDGVIVYLNGAEVYRNNMPAGAITYSTLASDTVEPDAYLQATLASNGLVAGTNVLAAEIHQGEVTSSDVNFDLALSGMSVSNVASVSLVYISKPASHEAFISPTNITITAFAQSGAAAANRVEFYADGSKIGEDASAPFSQVWTNPPNGSHTLQVVATLGSSRIVSAPVAVTVAPPTTVPPALAWSLIPTGSVWRYLAVPNAAPSSWATSGFNDSLWSSGPAELGFGDGDETTSIDGGPSNNRYPTVYFRHAFLANDPAAVTNLSLRLKRDDGVVVYLNGVEIARDNMPPGAPAYGTLATNAADDGESVFTFAIDPSLLAIGSNVVATEVHQSALNSSDLSFELALDALASTNRSRGIWLTAPAPGATVALPGTVTLRAEIVAGGTLGVSRVEFFADGAKIGEATTPPYALAWTEPPAGAHSLVAVATDTALNTITSAPVAITVSAPPQGTALVSFGDVWKYLDDGSNQGAAWTARAFDDRTWASGVARLGYGGDGEITTVSFGPNTGAKHVTTYFRRTFTVSNPAAFGSLWLRLIRDDGAVVYLNGVEVFRNNLQPGPVSWNSLAVTAVDGTGESAPVETNLPPTGLLAGTNLLAVEIHQATIASSDLGFDLALAGLTPTNTAEGIYLSSPAQGAHFNAPASVSLTAQAASLGGVSFVEYFAGDTRIGQATISPYRLTWSNPPVGSHALTARATLTGGGFLTSPVVTISVGSPPPPIQPVVATLIPAGTDWKYWDNVAAVGSGWQRPDFDDSAWPAAPARFGWGWDGEVTLLTEGRVTHYFRREFNVVNPATYSELVFQLARDDGAVVYLNGVEIFRSNMPGGTVTAATPAANSVNTPDETTYFETPVAMAGSGLMPGTNLVAVELHQGSATSSDAGFDLQLAAYGTTEPRVLLGSPPNNAVFQNTSPIAIEAFAQPRAGTTVSRVEFFTDGVKLGETGTAPYRLVWTTPSYGAHTLAARLTDSAGSVLDSAPVRITVARESVTTLLIPSNSVWRFLDNGSNQGTNWAQPSFNDSAWSSGVARLGYGGDGEVTPVSYGSNPGNKYITTYFRRAFMVPEGAVYTNLDVRLVRDDGAVVWLNGREIFRSNMPTGTVSYNTLASAAVSAAAEQTFYLTSVGVAPVSGGTNLLAVEVHQSAVDSSDLGFNLELSASGYVDDSVVPALAVAAVDGLLELSWSETAVGWRVYAAPDLATPAANWTPVTDPPVVVNGRKLIVVAPTAEAQFFQLGKP